MRIARRAVHKPDRRGAHLARSGIGRENQHDVPEIGLAARIVRERGVIHHLQQDVVDVRMRLLEFVEQDDAVRVRADRVDEQATLLEADVSRRRADEPRDRMLLHVLAHVEADELVAELIRQLLGELRLADACRPREQEAARRPVRLAESRPRSFDRLRDDMDGLALTEHHALE